MAHTYFSFDFGTDEDKAQQARHKLEMWKQAFRLDKKMLYKFERESDSDEDAASGDGSPKSEETEKPAQQAKPAKAGKSNKKDDKKHDKQKEDADDGADAPSGK